MEMTEVSAKVTKISALTNTQRGHMALEEALIEATRFFTRDVLGAEAELFDSCPLTHSWAACVHTEGDENWRVTVHIAQPSLEKMAFLFLNEEQPDGEVLTDLIKEISNLIVGRAKVTAAARGVNFNITTPDFKGDAVSICRGADKCINFQFEGDIFTITAHKVNVS